MRKQPSTEETDFGRFARAPVRKGGEKQSRESLDAGGKVATLLLFSTGLLVPDGLVIEDRAWRTLSSRVLDERLESICWAWQVAML